MMDIQKVSFNPFGYYGRVAKENFHFPKLGAGMNKLYYIHDGSIDVTLTNGVQCLEKGHLYLIPNSVPNTMYTHYVDHTCFNFYTFPHIGNSSIIDIPLADEPILEAHIHALSLVVEKFPRVWVNINEGQMNFVASSLRNILFLISEKAEIVCSKDNLMEKVIDYVHVHYTEKLSIAELASLFRMDEGTFIRRFKRSTAMTPYRYIKLLRVHHAQSLLKECTRTLEEVAQEVGYADAPTLSHAMKNCEILKL